MSVDLSSGFDRKDFLMSGLSKTSWPLAAFRSGTCWTLQSRLLKGLMSDCL